MKKIIGYLKEYMTQVDKRVFAGSAVFTGVTVFYNYTFGLNRAINNLSFWAKYLAWFALFFLVFSFGYALQQWILKKSFFSQRSFLLLLVLAPAIFAWKMAGPVHFQLSKDVFQNNYWNAVVYWPVKVIVITLALYVVYRVFNHSDFFYGVGNSSLSAGPYLLMLLAMLPLVALASTQPDFLRMYPRLQHVEYLLQPGRGWHKLLYELSYGSDFFSIELFFRGFLVFAFVKYAGKGAILPMAIFYCTIHFGKPLGECISSFFGGIILGVVSIHTRSILGGFFIHVGLAWMMELGGYLGHQSFS